MLRQLIADELARRGWNRYKLAKLMAERGHGQYVIYNWLAGRRGISMQAFEDICRALRIRLVPVQMLPDEADPSDDAPEEVAARRDDSADDQPHLSPRRQRPPAGRG